MLRKLSGDEQRTDVQTTPPSPVLHLVRPFMGILPEIAAPDRKVGNAILCSALTRSPPSFHVVVVVVVVASAHAAHKQRTEEMRTRMLTMVYCILPSRSVKQ